MNNKPAYDNQKSDETCWLNLRPAINLLAHGHDTVLGGTPTEWAKYIANLKVIEAKMEQKGMTPQSVSSEDQCSLKLTHKFLVEKPEKIETAYSEDESDTGKAETDTGSDKDLPHEFTLEGWPVPDSWNRARETLLEKNYAIEPLNAFVYGKDTPIRPSRYEQKLKGAVAHVAFNLIAYKFQKERRIRFIAVAKRITVLIPPVSTAKPRAKRKAETEEDNQSSQKKRELESPSRATDVVVSKLGLPAATSHIT
ncbi:hypothetical protein M378DRAFT_177642 [Amanita muscaria Koide BX008]|uniref:Uncharacterized protein n=1 Tax=Amanita muscaria (strain Koide BX008) TaxID=946122 RepID=A0A0C2XBS3_AMAMK|nr:hypothetical protein M378DRAFT_177642 [Amanita muscaria Koide BX008]